MAFFGGFWSPFFHIAADFFGMENYFIKMYTDPAVAEAVTSHVVEYFYQANKMLFEKAADLIDVFFFGNDFGTQLDLILSPEMFKKFIYPGIIKLVNLAKQYNLKVAMHSCGSIYRIIPLLIDAGIDILHPIQAKAKNMDAIYLNKNFKDKIVFMGGVDTQELLPFGTEAQVTEEVKRLMDLFGPNYILSPSHEALLKNVSTKNLTAMAKAAKH
jgi:uroporphyrinogen decarboxylase